jgi:hypothetical protein
MVRRDVSENVPEIANLVFGPEETEKPETEAVGGSPIEGEPTHQGSSGEGEDGKGSSKP